MAVSGYGNPYMFTARRYDDETGLYYYRARYYKPEIGRFMSPDPVYYDNAFVLYSYCDNNPTSYIDPYGLSNWKWGWWDVATFWPHMWYDAGYSMSDGAIKGYKGINKAFEMGEKRREYQKRVAEGGKPSLQDPVKKDFDKWRKDATDAAISVPGMGSTGNPPISIPTKGPEMVIPAIQGAIEGGTKDCPKSDDPDDVNKGM